MAFPVCLRHPEEGGLPSAIEARYAVPSGRFTQTPWGGILAEFSRWTFAEGS